MPDRHPFSSAAHEIEIVLFHLDQRTFGLPLDAVERVVRMVETTPLPAAPAVVSGVVDVGGEILPVFNLRARFDLPARDSRVSDRLIIASTPARRVALAVDGVGELIAVDTTCFEPAEAMLTNLPHVAGVARVAGRDLVVIQNLTRFLSLDEEALLATALEQNEH